MIWTSSEDIQWQSDDVATLFRLNIMIEIAKANCLNIRISVLESPTRLILVL
jgi:hypothetical protein